MYYYARIVREIRCSTLVLPSRLATKQLRALRDAKAENNRRRKERRGKEQHI